MNDIKDAEKNYILATKRNELDAWDQYLIDDATGKLIRGTRNDSGGTAKLDPSGALEILYAIGRMMKKQEP